MAHPIVSTPRLEAAMQRIRPVALALPGVVERVSHARPVRRSSRRRWSAGRRSASSCRPTWFTAAGSALRLDLPEVDWDEVAGVIEDAHAYVLGA